MKLSSEIVDNFRSHVKEELSKRGYDRFRLEFRSGDSGQTVCAIYPIGCVLVEPLALAQ